MSALSGKLLSAKLRESSGARTLAKYGYQLHIGILKIVEAHESGADYRMVFDYIDDLAMLDSSSIPATMSLFQVKAKSAGSWTIAGLAQRPTAGDLPKSIIGKMYYSIHHMAADISEVRFVSNAPYSALFSNGKKTCETDTVILASDLDDTEMAKLDLAISADFPGETVLSYKEKLKLEQNSLGVMDQDVFVKGRIFTFLEKETGGQEAPASAVYDTLVARALSRTGNAKTYADVDEFYALKSIGRPEISELVEAIKSKRGFFDHWSSIEADLTKCGASPLDAIKIKTGAARYLNLRTAGHKTAQLFANSVASAKSAIPDLSIYENISDLMKTIAAAVTSDAPPGWSITDISGACLVEAFEALNG